MATSWVIMTPYFCSASIYFAEEFIIEQPAPSWPHWRTLLTMRLDILTLGKSDWQVMAHLPPITIVIALWMPSLGGCTPRDLVLEMLITRWNEPWTCTFTLSDARTPCLRVSVAV